MRLNHLNLERCGLIEPAIKYITALLRRSQALRSLHLCGNDGLSPQLIEWIRKRIHARPHREDRVLLPASVQKKYDDNVKGAPMKRGLMKVNRGLSLDFESPSHVYKQWSDIRMGLKLRNIVQSMRLNDVSQQMMPGMEWRKCIIQRQLGHKEIMPGSAQWGIFSKQKDECWICAHHILTVFVWTPRVGQLAQERDPVVYDHYKQQLDEVRKTWAYPPSFFDGAPFILGPFTNWEPRRMQQAIEYSMKNDP